MLGLRGAFILTFRSRDPCGSLEGIYRHKVSRAAGNRLCASLQMPFAVGFHEAAAIPFETQCRTACEMSVLVDERA
jgi:hypothetical protein